MVRLEASKNPESPWLMDARTGHPYLIIEKLGFLVRVQDLKTFNPLLLDEDVIYLCFIRAQVARTG